MGTVTGLSPFTEYSCTIHAVTVAEGPVSDPVVARTAEAGTVSSYPHWICINCLSNTNSSQSSSDHFSH